MLGKLLGDSKAREAYEDELLEDIGFVPGQQSLGEQPVKIDRAAVSQELIDGFIEYAEISEAVTSTKRDTWLSQVSAELTEAKQEGYASLFKPNHLLLGSDPNNESKIAPRGILYNRSHGKIFAFSKIWHALPFGYSSHALALDAQLDDEVGEILRNASSEFSLLGRKYEFTGNERVELDTPVLYVPGISKKDKETVSAWESSSTVPRTRVEILGNRLFAYR